MAPTLPAKLTTGNVRIYYYFLLGAAGGLTGWYLTGLFAAGGVVSQVLQGALLGGLIGLGAGVFDGIASKSMVRVAKFGGASLLFGIVAGAIALPLVQVLYESLAGLGSAGRFLAGTVCWILFGGMIGLGEGISKGAQTWKGLVGGMIGGALGGGVYEAVGRDQTNAQSLLALAVLILGGFIGSSVALVTSVLRDAWLLVETGPLAGNEINISKYVHEDLGSRRAGIIGSSQWEANIYLPNDSGVLPKHASISYVNGAPTLMALSNSLQRRPTTLVNGRAVSSWPLSNGDRLQIGGTSLQYRQSRTRR